MPLLRRATRRRLLIALTVIGPGIITANVDNDAGGITTYSLAGAHFGYTFLWTLIPITLALIVVQEMAARMGVVTGKGLADLIREACGIRATVYLMVALLVANLGNTAAEFAGWAASLEIFGISKYLSVPVAALVVWWLVVKGTYRVVERVFLFACLMYVTYIASALLARPPWGLVLRSVVTPRLAVDRESLLMFIGLVGTTIAPWMQFYQQSAVVEKGVKLRDYAISRLDVVVGCLFTDVVAFFIIVATAATLYAQGIRIEDAKDAAIALVPLAGKYAAALFAIGLANASLFSAAVLPLATAYYVCEGMGWEAGIDKTFREAPHFLWLYTAILALGAAIVLIPGAPLIPILFLSQVANGVLLPFVLIFMLLLVNRRDLMGDHVNPPLYNVVAWGCTGTLILLTLLLVAATLFPSIFGRAP